MQTILPPQQQKEIKDEVLKEVGEDLKDYSQSQSKTDAGSTLRKIAKVVSKLLPFLKYINLNKK